MNLNRGVLRLWLAISGIWMILVMGITSYGSAAPISYLKFYRPLSVTDSGNVLYLDEPEWKPALTMVYPPRRELFVLDGVGWRKLSSPQYTEIARRSSRGRPLSAPAAFIHPCQPIVDKQPPSGFGWAHELKHIL
jgi:hypothetical protein